MAHHSAEMPDAYAREAEKLKLGATGEYPRGKLNDDDEGEIVMGIAADPKNGVVVMNFGKPTSWIGFTGEQAEQIAQSLSEKALELRGITP